MAVDSTSFEFGDRKQILLLILFYLFLLSFVATVDQVLLLDG